MEKKFDTEAGVMEVGSWTALQAEKFLDVPYYERPERKAESLDMFTALYGMDRRKASPGQHGARSERLLDEAQSLAQWPSLKAKSEAKPWACAAAAKMVLDVVGHASHQEKQSDRQEQQASQHLQSAQQQFENEQRKADQQQQQDGQPGDDQPGSEGNPGDGDEGKEQDQSEGERGQDGDGSPQDGNDGSQDGQGGQESGGDEQADQDGEGQQSAQDSQGGQGSGQQGQQRQEGQSGRGTGVGAEQKIQDQAASTPELERAKKELEKAQANHRSAQLAQQQAQEQGKQERQERMAAAMASAEKMIDETEEAMRGFQAGVAAGTERAFGTPLDDLARELSKNPEFLKIMKWAGRMAMTGRAKARQRRGGGSAETVDVTTGGLSDICDVVPAELLGLVDPDLEILLDKSIAEESLQIEKKRDRDPEERGPVVACVDESGSMDGDRLVWAKAVAFAMFLRCVEENRPFAVVRFDSGHEIVNFRYPRQAKWDDLERWLKGFRCGGTNIPRALLAADRFIQNQAGFKKADVLLVTDGHGGFWHDMADEMRGRGRSIYGVRIGLEWEREDVKHLEESIHLTDRQLLRVESSLKKMEGALSV